MQADYSQLRDEEKSDFWKEQIESWMGTGLSLLCMQQRQAG